VNENILFEIRKILSQKRILSAQCQFKNWFFKVKNSSKGKNDFLRTTFQKSKLSKNILFSESQLEKQKRISNYSIFAINITKFD